MDQEPEEAIELATIAESQSNSPVRHLLQFHRLKDFTREKIAPKPKAVGKRPLHTWSKNRKEWEISLIVNSDFLQKIASNIIFPKIPDILQSIPVFIMGKQFPFECSLQFDPLLISFKSKHPNTLIFELPIAKGQVAGPGYIADYTGAKIIFELPMDQVSIEVRWESPEKAHAILDVEKKLEVSYRIENIPKHDLLKSLIDASNNVVRTIIQSISLDGRVLGEFIIPQEEMKFIDYFEDALPTRIYLAPVKYKKDGKVSMDALAVQIICNGKYVSQTTELAFASQENLVLKISNGLLTKGILISVLQYVFKNFQEKLSTDEFSPSKLGIGITTKNFDSKPSIDFDKPSKIITQPLILNYPSLVKALSKSISHEDNFDLSLGFSAFLKDNFVNLLVQLDVLLHKDWYGAIQIILKKMELKYEIAFSRKTDGIYLTATPKRIYIDATYKNKSSWLEKILQYILLDLLYSVVILMISSFFVFLLAVILGIGVVVEFPEKVAMIKDLSKLSDLLKYIKQYPDDIPGIVEQINKTQFLATPLTVEMLTFTQKLPAQLDFLNQLRMDTANESLNFYGEFLPAAPGPRKKPEPLAGAVNIYEFIQNHGTSQRRFYTTDSKPPVVTLSNPQYTERGIAFMAFPAKPDPIYGCIPVYQYRVSRAGFAQAGATGYVNSFSDTVEDLKKEFNQPPDTTVTQIGIAFWVPASPIFFSSSKGFLYRNKDVFGSIILTDHERQDDGFERIVDPQFKLYVR